MSSTRSNLRERVVAVDYFSVTKMTESSPCSFLNMIFGSDPNPEPLRHTAFPLNPFNIINIFTIVRCSPNAATDFLSSHNKSFSRCKLDLLECAQNTILVSLGFYAVILMVRFIPRKQSSCRIDGDVASDRYLVEFRSNERANPTIRIRHRGTLFCVKARMRTLPSST